MWILFPLVFLAGFVDSIAGGGGLISLPAFFAVGLPPHTALGTNKFTAFLGTGISTARFAKNGSIRWITALYSVLGALIGSPLGAKLALYINERVITWLMLFIVPVVSVLMLRNKRGESSEKEPLASKTALPAFITGFVIGAYDGFFGPGTGMLLIMAFTSVLSMPLLTACGNAKAVNFTSNIAAAVTFAVNGAIDYRIGIPCVFCSILGNYSGSGLALKKGSRVIKPMLFVVMTILTAKMAWDLFR